MTKLQRRAFRGLSGLLFLSVVQLVLNLVVWAAEVKPVISPSPTETFSVLNIVPLANMGIGAIIAILLIWSIYPVITRNTETLREIATTLNVMSSNNLLLAQKLLDVIERQSFLIRGQGGDR